MRNEDHIYTCSQPTYEYGRYLNPDDISVLSGYTIKVYAHGLDTPSCFAFSPEGELYIGESGYISNKPALLRMKNGQFELLAEGFETPLSGICIHEGIIYVSHKSKISIVNSDGTIRDIIGGLPSQGDFWNSNVTIGPDRKLYFGQGTATNSGVVGNDNLWVHDVPCFRDYPGSYVMVRGQNFAGKNIFSARDSIISTGAFAHYGVMNIPYEVKKGVLKASGCILRANLDGSNMEQVAWGLRFITCIRYDLSGRLFVSNQGYENRGSRPIANAPDEFIHIEQGGWYGWPDFAGGEPVILEKYKPEGGPQPEFLLTSHPGVPPKPYALFPSNSYIVGFDFNYNRNFGVYGDAYITEYGMGGQKMNDGASPYTGTGHRVSRIDMSAGTVSTFAINKSGFPSFVTGGGGLSRPVDLTFGPDGAMYVLDAGINSPLNLSYYYPNTGVIWRISRE